MSTDKWQNIAGSKKFFTADYLNCMCWEALLDRTDNYYAKNLITHQDSHKILRQKIFACLQIHRWQNLKQQILSQSCQVSIFSCVNTNSYHLENAKLA